MTALRISAKFQRFELLLIAIVLLAWALAVGVVGLTLHDYTSRFPDCFGLTNSPGPACRGASASFGAWDQTAELLLWAVLAIPVAVGSVLGAPIVSREVEHGTAQLSWAISPSRLYWLAFRIAPVLIFVLATMLVAAVGGEFLQRVRLGGEDAGFLRFDQRGLLVVTRGVAVFGVALLIGTLIGRSLPALLISLVVSVVVLVGSIAALDAWRRTEAVVVEFTSPGAESVLVGALLLEPVAILPDGTVTADMIHELPEGTNFDAVRIIPQDRYGVWVMREAAIDVVLSVVVLAGAIVALKNRRPI